MILKGRKNGKDNNQGGRIRRNPGTSERRRRYFIFQGFISLERFKEEAGKRGIGPGDNVYLVPAPGDAISEFRKTVPDLFDLTRYDPESIAAEARNLGYEVIRIE